MPLRRCLEHTATFEERLADQAARFRDEADKAQPGIARELLLKRARQAETASHMSEWLRSPSLQPPR